MPRSLLPRCAIKRLAFPSLLQLSVSRCHEVHEVSRNQEEHRLSDYTVEFCRQHVDHGLGSDITVLTRVILDSER